MIPDREILDGILAHRRPMERKRLAGLLGIDDDADFAGTLARLVREGLLDRIEQPAPGKTGVSWTYWPTPAGKPAANPSAPAEEPVPITTHKESPPMSTQHEVASRRTKIIAFLTDHPDALASAIAEHLKVDADTVNRDIWALKSTGRIIPVGDKRPVGYRVASGKEGAKPKAAPAPAKRAKPGKRPKRDAAIASRTPASSPPTPGNFTVALTSNDTLLMLRRDGPMQVELQRDEIGVLTAFLRRLDQATAIPR